MKRRKTAIRFTGPTSSVSPIRERYAVSAGMGQWLWSSPRINVWADVEIIECGRTAVRCWVQWQMEGGSRRYQGGLGRRALYVHEKDFAPLPQVSQAGDGPCPVRVRCRLGMRTAINSAMIAMTTESSINVKPFRPLKWFLPPPHCCSQHTCRDPDVLDSSPSGSPAMRGTHSPLHRQPSS